MSACPRTVRDLVDAARADAEAGMPEVNVTKMALRLAARQGHLARALLDRSPDQVATAAVQVAATAILLMRMHASRMAMGDFDNCESAVRDEIDRSRRLFPDPFGAFCALVEETGEFADAVLGDLWQDPFEEAAQVAATAIRIAEEGDASLDPVRQRRGQPPMVTA